MLDAEVGGDAWVAALRALPGLWGSTPMVSAGDPGTEAPPGVVGRIELPFDEGAALAAIEEWTGPLADPALRDPDSAAYRLLRLVGMTRACAMLGRFADELEVALAVLAGPESGADLAALAHRISGVAGLYGFAELGGLWLAVQRDESAADVTLAEATRSALVDVRKWSKIKL